MKGIEIFDHCFLLIARDLTFFFGNSNSVKNLMYVFQTFLQFSGLKPNINECKIASIGLLKGAIGVVHGLKLVDLPVDTIKIFDLHFFYNKEAEIQKKKLSQLERYKMLFVCGIQGIFH